MLVGVTGKLSSTFKGLTTLNLQIYCSVAPSNGFLLTTFSKYLLNITNPSLLKNDWGVPVCEIEFVICLFID
jgi:hypothetical protein